MTIAGICVPEEWDDKGIVLFEEFCALIRTPPRSVRERHPCGRGPTWHRFNGNGRLDMPVAEPRRFLGAATTSGRRRCRPQSEGRKP